MLPCKHGDRERAILLCEGGSITRDHLPVRRTEGSLVPGGEITQRVAAGFRPEGTSFDTVDRRLVERALAEAPVNKPKAARLLGLTRRQFYALLERHGLD